jgi:predicted RNase H-like HicB family nuclease
VPVNKIPPTHYFKVLTLKIGVTVHKEGKWYVAADPVTGVASQGKSCDEAVKNFQEAFELWFENAEEWEKERTFQIS